MVEVCVLRVCAWSAAMAGCGVGKGSAGECLAQTLAPTAHVGVSFAPSFSRVLPLPPFPARPQGSLRVDANVSVRKRGQEAKGTRVEIKNVNGTRHLRKAIGGW